MTAEGWRKGLLDTHDPLSLLMAELSRRSSLLIMPSILNLPDLLKKSVLPRHFHPQILKKTPRIANKILKNKKTVL
jgi:hypothetical protein